MYPHETLSSVHGLISGFFRSPSGDLADRLSSRITVFILSILSAVLISSHYWGEPINCWVPAEYPEGWAKFVDRYCYVHATYYIPMTEPVPWNTRLREHTQITYYQWVPYFLALQAIMFFLPRLIWKCLCRYFGIDIPLFSYRFAKTWAEVHENAESFNSRLLTIRTLTVPQFRDFLRFYRKQHNPAMLPLAYLFSKGLHALNAVLQWYWLNRFLSSNVYSFWGPAIVRDLWNGIGWEETGHFPRLTHCDFTRRRPASYQLDTVVCVLTLNLYYEKICLFLWFWFLLVAGFNILATLRWLWTLSCSGNHRRLIDRFLYSVDTETDSLEEQQKNPSIRIEGVSLESGMNHERNTGDLDAFIETELGLDGIFIIRMLSVNVGSIPTAYLVKALYQHFHGNILTHMGKRLTFLGNSNEYVGGFGNIGYASPRTPKEARRKRSLMHKILGLRDYEDSVKEV